VSGLDHADRESLAEVLTRARDRGFLGPGPIDEHIHHADAYTDLIEPEAIACLDLGSGGGVPALVLAKAIPHTTWILVETMAKRANFLRGASRDLELADRVLVLEARAESLPDPLRGAFDVVTARSFGSPAVTAECAAPWLRIGGDLVVSEPPGGDAGRWPADGLAVLGLAVESRLGRPSLVRLRQVSACPTRYPRRAGIPAKRPLF
jgi:16S rRNA (guanine527-N7)-methyltransferase